MESRNIGLAIGALAAGAAGMYLLDPAHGRRRRALARDQIVHAGHAGADTLSVIARDTSNRVMGLVAQQRSRFMPGEEPSSERLEARARSILGRVVSHPHAITVDAHDSHLTVSGYILQSEVQPLLAALQTIPGVSEVENHLEVGRNPGEMPSLQGGRRREGLQPDILQRRMAPATRVLVGAGALGLASYGLGRRDWLGGIYGALGLLIGARAATNLEFRRLVGLGGGREAVRLQNSIEVDAPVDIVFDFFRSFENFPRFMQHIRQVRPKEGDVWHWEADGPLGTAVSWDAVVTRVQPYRRISWKSVPGSEVGNAGTAWFEPTRDGTTRVHINMVYNPPAGALGHAISSLLGADPVHQMDEDLVRFKSLIERGKTSAKGEEIFVEVIPG